MNGTCLLDWGKGGGSVACSKGCSNLFSWQWQLKGEENKGRSGTLIQDAPKEFLDLFAAITENFLFWPLFPCLYCQSRGGEQLHSPSHVTKWVGAEDWDPKAPALHVSFLSQALFISGSAVHECQQAATVLGSFFFFPTDPTAIARLISRAVTLCASARTLQMCTSISKVLWASFPELITFLGLSWLYRNH